MEFEQNDIEFEIEKNDTKICLTCKDFYDDYEWYMGTRILSNMEYCEIDFAGYEKNVYPIVLFVLVILLVLNRYNFDLLLLLLFELKH